MNRPVRYPESRAADVEDLYHGSVVPDPYQWLEDLESAETGDWIAGQNALTRSMLDRPVRAELVARLTHLHDYPRASPPLKRGGRYFVSYNTGLLDQPVLYVQDGPRAPARVLLDPNSLSQDGTVALTAIEPDDTGMHLAYALSRSGSDRQEIYVRRVADATDLPDRILWAKFVSIAWLHDGSGFFYTRYPEPGTVAAGQEHYFCAVYFHRLGNPQERDVRVYHRPDQPDTVFDLDLTSGDRWLVVTALEGASDRSEVVLIDPRNPSASPVPLFTGFDSSFKFIDAAGSRLFFITDRDAPRGRVLAVDPTRPSPATTDVVAETPDKLNAAAIAGDALVLSYLHQASDRIRLFGLDGSERGGIELPGIGSLTGLDARPDDEEVLLGFTSFTRPPSNFRFDLEDRRLVERAPPVPAPGDAWFRRLDAEFETTQVWYPSKDGTRVSMFLVHRRGLPKDGARPVLLTGYGGFNINLVPTFDPAAYVLIERGGILAVPNLRGGGEYGEAWHEAGMRERKQNVFDDFIAAAGWLVASGYTRPNRIAVEGGSNGGLLTAAVMIQAPERIGAVVCRVPVADMLRYHRFTVGRYWIPEYGSADDPAQFAYLIRYSPYHNVRDDRRYPPILITTADTDDRVFPGMALKFAARLQASRGNHSAVLVRIDTKAGHGAGKPLSKIIDEDADIFTFIFESLEVGRP